MWIDRVKEYDIIVETLTGAREIEVTVTDNDTIGYIKTHIQKSEGIPIRQQHLIFNQHELSDATEVKDVPLKHGSRLKLVIGMKGGPISAQRRLVKISDLDTWLDLNSVKQDQFTISSAGVKLLFYKDNKKNVHRVKLRTDRKNSSSQNTESVHAEADDQFLKDNLNTMQKMQQLRAQFELKKRDKASKISNKLSLNSMNSKKVDGEMVCSKKPPLDHQKSEGKIGSAGDDFGASGGTIFKLGSSASKTSRKHSRRSYLPSLKNFMESATNLKKNSESETKRLTDSSILGNKHRAQKPKSQQIEANALDVSCMKSETETEKNGTVTKSNWIQNLIEIMKNSKVPLSPSELIEIKESFESINQSPPQLEKISELKPSSPFESMLSDFDRATTISSERYHSKIRENIQRNRSFRSTEFIANKTKRNFGMNRSMDELPDASLSNWCESLSSLRSCDTSNKSPIPPSTDLNSFIKSDSNYRLYLRRMTTPKNASTGFENEMFLGKPDQSRSNERNTFPDEFAQFKSSSNPTAFGPVTAKAIADSSSFRVYKMTTDAKNYELPKLLIREGSPIESFRSSDTQLETLALRCDSPKSVIPTIDNILETPSSVAPRETIPLQLNTVIATSTNQMNSTELDESSELDTLLYDNDLAIGFDGAEAGRSDESSHLSNNRNNHESYEVIDDSKTNKSDNFRAIFGSSPLLNYNNGSSTACCLDSIPMKHRRGYTNLKEACLSSSTSNIKDTSYANHFGKESMFTATSSTINKVGSENSIGQEKFSLLRKSNNAPVDYVRSYEKLNRTKIASMKSNNKRILGNTNYGYSDGDTISNHSNCSRSGWQNWRYDTFWNMNQEQSVHSNDSLFDVNFDLTDDGSIHVDSMNLLDVAEFSHANRTFFENENVTNNDGEQNKQNSIQRNEERDICANFDPPISDTFNLKRINENNTFNIGEGITKYDSIKNEFENVDKQLAFNHICNMISLDEEIITKQPIQKPTVLPNSEKPKSTKLRCNQCNIKLGIIMVMKCHCGKIFCAKHRYAEAHNCSYDYKKEGQNNIAIENPLVVASKLTKL